MNIPYNDTIFSQLYLPWGKKRLVERKKKIDSEAHYSHILGRETLTERQSEKGTHVHPLLSVHIQWARKLNTPFSASMSDKLVELTSSEDGEGGVGWERGAASSWAQQERGE